MTEEQAIKKLQDIINDISHNDNPKAILKILDVCIEFTEKNGYTEFSGELADASWTYFWGPGIDMINPDIAKQIKIS